MLKGGSVENLDAVWKTYGETKDPQIREDLILKYAYLVKQVASSLGIYLGTQVEFDDLVGYGIFGLIDAIDKFDVTKGIKFETYASLRIRGAIIDSLRDLDWTPRVLRQRIKDLEKIYIKLEAKLGRFPTYEEIALELDITVAEVCDLISKSATVALVSFEDYVEQNRDIADTTHETPEAIFDTKATKQILSDIIQNLPERERLIITLHYFENLTLREISKTLGISEGRISQIHNNALLAMRAKMGDDRIDMYL